MNLIDSENLFISFPKGPIILTVADCRITITTLQVMLLNKLHCVVETEHIHAQTLCIRVNDNGGH